MGKFRRRTITIVITETWTIAWSDADDSLHPENNVVHMDPELVEETKGELNETLQSSLITANLDPSQPAARPLVPGDVPANSTGGKRKRDRHRSRQNP
jgi:hypothetical protein